MHDGVLNGIRVLDFTWMLAGPYATRILADFGAEVIKVQSQRTATGTESNITGYFNTWNRNKRGITLDMSYPEAREIVLKLTGISDVVIENFSPRVMSNWGLTYENLRKVRSDLIMVSVSGMGQTGPWRDFVAFGPTIQALSSLTYLTSFTKDTPVGLGYSYADIIAGLYAAFAILGGLEHRDKTGQGLYIDVSEYEAMCTLLGPTLLHTSSHEEDVLPQGNRPDYVPAAPYGCYPCQGIDRWCVISVSSEHEWQALCDVMGDPAWSNEERFSTISKRRQHGQELDELLEQWTVKHTAEEVVRVLQKAGVAAGVVQNAEDLTKDPQLRSRDFFMPLEHPVLGATISNASPIRFTEATTRKCEAAPLLGEDNEYVYVELLGLTESEFSAYVDRGIIS